MICVHCRKFNSVKVSDVHLMSKTDAAVGNLVCWLIAMTLTRGLSDCNAEFKSISSIQEYFVRC